MDEQSRLRVIALAEAVHTSPGNTSETPQAVVQRAEAYYAFLSGESKAE